MRTRRGWRSLAAAKSQWSSDISFAKDLRRLGKDPIRRPSLVGPRRSVHDFQQFLAALAPQTERTGKKSR
jgi:hypothetical protein